MSELPQHAFSLGPELEIAVRAAAAAGEIVQSGYGQLNVVEEKDAGDLVSQVDRDADTAAMAVLNAHSDLPILSEELHHDTHRSEDMWIVDPLDGSTAYLMGADPQYPAVLVAGRQAGRTSVAAAYFPLTDEWFYAQRGRGAWRNGKRLICDHVDSDVSQVWVEMNRYGNPRWETNFFAQLEDRLRSTAGAMLVTSNVPHSGVAMRIAMSNSSLAVAVHDNNPDHVKQGPWDIAAPQLIMEEAGGVFLNPRGERTDLFVAEPIIVARSRTMAERIIETVMRQPADS